MFNKGKPLERRLSDQVDEMNYCVDISQPLLQPPNPCLMGSLTSWPAAGISIMESALIFLEYTLDLPSWLQCFS